MAGPLRKVQSGNVGSRRKSRKKSRRVRRLITLAIFAAISLIFLIFLRYVTTEKQAPPNYFQKGATLGVSPAQNS